jgi:hypothetical protein
MQSILGVHLAIFYDFPQLAGSYLGKFPSAGCGRNPIKRVDPALARLAVQRASVGWGKALASP